MPVGSRSSRTGDLSLHRRRASARDIRPVRNRVRVRLRNRVRVRARVRRPDVRPVSRPFNVYAPNLSISGDFLYSLRIL